MENSKTLFCKTEEVAIYFSIWYKKKDSRNFCVIWIARFSIPWNNKAIYKTKSNAIYFKLNLWLYQKVMLLLIFSPNFYGLKPFCIRTTQLGCNINLFSIAIPFILNDNKFDLCQWFIPRQIVLKNVFEKTRAVGNFNQLCIFESIVNRGNNTRLSQLSYFDPH